MPATSTQSWATAIRNEYGDKDRFLTTFNPGMQIAYARNELQCFATEKAPSLVRVARTYGDETAESWLETQLYDLSEFSGCKDKMGVRQIESLAKVIIGNYGYLKVTELMVFFQRFKAGHYGKFYGSVDAMVITTALCEFISYRSLKLNEIQQIKDRERRERIYREMEENRKQSKHQGNDTT